MKYTVYERGWNVDYYEVEAESKEAAIEVGIIKADPVNCNCKGNCEHNLQCLCNNIPCEDDEGICEHTRGCLHGECNCECEF